MFDRGNANRWISKDRDPPFTRRSRADQTRSVSTLTLGLLHLAPRCGDLPANRRLIEQATRVAGFEPVEDLDDAGPIVSYLRHATH